MKFIKRYYAAQELIKQIREGKWTVHWNTIDDSHLTAGCGSLELWIGNGPFFCEVSLDFCAPETAENRKAAEDNKLGLFWRHYVWWAAARELKIAADKTRCYLHALMM